MKRKIFSLMLLLTVCISSLAATVAPAVTPIDLRCEYLWVARSIDVAKPRLSWTILAPDQRGVTQSAYRIVVASSEDKLNAGVADIWDSGKVTSRDMSQVEYAGKPLRSFQTCHWKVMVWDQAGQPSKWSKPAAWSMGVLSKQDWGTANWIAFKSKEQWSKEWAEHKDYERKHAKLKWPWFNCKDSTIFQIKDLAKPLPYDAAPLLRKTFSASNVSHATLYICGLGYFEAFINHTRVGNDVLNPAWTNFNHRSFYCTYDVTSLITNGDNAIGVMLGRGQYNPLTNDIWKLSQSAWVDQPKLIALLRIERADGSVTNIVTDDSWKVAPGPIVYDDTRQGEIYDARQKHEGWTTATYDDSAWANASIVPCDNPLRSQTIPPVRRQGSLKPINVFKRAGNSTIYDLGCEIAGWAKVKVKGPAGAKVLVEYCEQPSDKELVPNIHPTKMEMVKEVAADSAYASFYDAGIRVRQQNGYILGGQGEESFECHFSYKGFQFIRVTADPEVEVLDVNGVKVHTDLKSVGNFECSNETANKMQENARITLLNNNMSIPTDCPHREKQGWTCDTYLTSRALLYNFDGAQYYTKWLSDLAETQNRDGELNDVAPSTAYDQGLTTTWPAAIVYMPIDLYNFYGDKRILEQNYEVMKRFATSSLKRQIPGKPDIINDVLGDWLSPKMEMPANLNDAIVMAPPEGLIYYGTSSQFKVVDDIARIASLLKYPAENLFYKQWSKRIAEACNKEFFDSINNVYHGNIATPYRQSPNAIALEFGIVPQDHRQGVIDGLMADIKKYNYRMGTGFLGTKAIMNIMPEIDPEAAYKLATQPEYPGWGYMIKNGATSMWEDWAGASSLNHTPFCLISEYFYKYLAGIRMSTADSGLPCVTIKPQVVGDLKWARASYRSMYGMITNEWRLVGKHNFEMNIELPANVEIEVWVPATSSDNVKESGKKIDGSRNVSFIRMDNGYAVYKVGSGNYTFTSANLR